MPVAYIPRTRELYHPSPPYRWCDKRSEPVPWTPLLKELSECRVALASSGGIYCEGQEPFHFKDDTSIRVIESGCDTADLRVAHFGYPIGDAAEDPNCVFPIDPLRDLVAAGEIGELAPHAVTFMGGIYSQRRVVEELIPAVLEEIQSQRVDLFYIVPA